MRLGTKEIGPFHIGEKHADKMKLYAIRKGLSLTELMRKAIDDLVASDKEAQAWVEEAIAGRYDGTTCADAEADTASRS